MKTNLVKKGSEKNIEMFKMSNDELSTINGGIAEVQFTRDEDGNLIVVVVTKNRYFSRSF